MINSKYQAREEQERVALTLPAGRAGNLFLLNSTSPDEIGERFK